MKGKEALRAASYADAERQQQRKSAVLRSPVTEGYQLGSAMLYFYNPDPSEKKKIEIESDRMFECAALSKDSDDEDISMYTFSSVRDLLPFALKKLRYSKMWNMKDRANDGAIPDEAFDLMHFIKDNGKSVNLKLSKEEVYSLFAIGCLAEIGSKFVDLTYEVIHRIIANFGYSNACEVLAEGMLKDLPGVIMYSPYFDLYKLKIILADTLFFCL